MRSVSKDNTKWISNYVPFSARVPPRSFGGLPPRALERVPWVFCFREGHSKPHPYGPLSAGQHKAALTRVLQVVGVYHVFVVAVTILTGGPHQFQ